jgi:stage V sporulation protein SpoVS
MSAVVVPAASPDAVSGALAGSARENQQADCAGRREPPGCMLRKQAVEREGFHRSRAVVVEEQCARLCKQPNYSKKKKNIADARRDEGFLCSCGG